MAIPCVVGLMFFFLERASKIGWNKDDVQPPARRAPSSVGSGRRSALAGCKRSAARCVNDPSEEVRQISQYFKCPKSGGEFLGQSFPPAAKFFLKLNAGRWPSRRSVASQIRQWHDRQNGWVGAFEGHVSSLDWTGTALGLKKWCYALAVCLVLQELDLNWLKILGTLGWTYHTENLLFCYNLW